MLISVKLYSECKHLKLKGAMIVFWDKMMKHVVNITS